MIRANHLPHQRKDEEILVLLRRDITVLLFRVVIYIALAAFPVLVYAFLKIYFSELLVDSAWKALFSIAGLTYYMFLWVFAYREFLDFYLDIWIVTNHRILSIELQGFFNRVVSEHKLFRIQDVTTEQKGFLSHVFNYGEVFIQTAGTKQRFIFEQVPDPNKVSRQIVQLIEWHKKAYPNEV